mgnify:CR=1 FL=1
MLKMLFIITADLYNKINKVIYEKRNMDNSFYFVIF